MAEQKSQEKTFTYHDEEKLGRLYILGKVENAGEDVKSYIVNLVASALRRSYYDYPNRKPKKALQASLNKSNQILEKFPNKKLNFICGVLCDDGLYIAQTKNNRFSKINHTQSEELQQTIKKAPKTPLNLFNKAKKFQISGLAKTLAVFYIIFVLILMSATYFSQKGIEKQEAVNYQNTLSQIKQKILQADAVMIYKEFDRAKNFLHEAENIAYELPAGKDKINLEQEIKAKLNKTNNLTEISDIKIIYLPDTLNLNGLIKIQNNLFSFNPENNRIYKIDQEPKRISRNSINIGYFKKSTLLESEDSILYLTDTPDLALYIVNKNTIEKPRINLPKSPIKDLSNYSSNIYFLTNNQIYKYFRTLAGFRGPYSWLKQEQEFTDPKSFVIDGDIYVLDNNKVLKFAQGEQQEFSLDKELENPVKIFTMSKLENLYVLEKNKILVFNKSGKLIAKHINSRFTNLTDIWVFKDKIIYLLNNQEILEFNL